MSNLIIRSPYEKKKDLPNGLPLNKRKVNNLFNSFKKEGLLEDRVEYDEDDLKSTYPQLNDKEAKMLYLKIQKWKHAQKRRKGGQHEEGVKTKAELSS